MTSSRGIAGARGWAGEQWPSHRMGGRGAPPERDRRLARVGPGACACVGPDTGNGLLNGHPTRLLGWAGWRPRGRESGRIDPHCVHHLAGQVVGLVAGRWDEEGANRDAFAVGGAAQHPPPRPNGDRQVIDAAPPQRIRPTLGGVRCDVGAHRAHHLRRNVVGPVTGRFAARRGVVNGGIRSMDGSGSMEGIRRVRIRMPSSRAISRIAARQTAGGMSSSATYRHTWPVSRSAWISRITRT